MNKKTDEQNGNEKNISHRILSWLSEHKMVTRLLVIGILALSISGAYLLVSNGECEYIGLTLSWDSPEIYEIKGDPAVQCHIDEEQRLMVKVSTTKSGILEITAKPEKDKPVWLTVTRENVNSWKKGEIQVYFHPSDNPLQETSIPVWVKAEKDSQGLGNHTIIVEASFQNEDCRVTKLAYIDVAKGPLPPSPTPSPSTTQPSATQITPFQFAVSIGALIAILIILLKKNWIAREPPIKKK